VSAGAERPAELIPQAPPDIIARRIEATAQLLKGSAADAYSIQLFVAGSEEQLRNHLKSLPKFIEMNNLYMYRSVAQGKPKVNVLWGSYPSRDEALEWIDELPPSLRANRPYVRTVEAIRAEMNRNSASR
jgi:septal ring-binding cell division protein DamX